MASAAHIFANRSAGHARRSGPAEPTSSTAGAAGTPALGQATHYPSGVILTRTGAPAMIGATFVVLTGACSPDDQVHTSFTPMDSVITSEQRTIGRCRHHAAGSDAEEW